MKPLFPEIWTNLDVHTRMPSNIFSENMWPDKYFQINSPLFNSCLRDLDGLGEKLKTDLRAQHISRCYSIFSRGALGITLRFPFIFVQCKFQKEGCCSSKCVTKFSHVKFPDNLMTVLWTYPAKPRSDVFTNSTCSLQVHSLLSVTLPMLLPSFQDDKASFPGKSLRDINIIRI